MNLAETLVDDFDADAALSRTILQAVPEDRFEWKPAEKSMSLAGLAGHIAESPSWLAGMMEDVLDFAAVAGDWKPFVPSDHAELMATFDRNAKLVAELLDGRDDDFMRATWKMQAGDQVMMEDQRHRAIRAFMINHSIHHRGQMTVYLRLLDVAVPPTFGPTADFPDM